MGGLFGGGSSSAGAGASAAAIEALVDQQRRIDSLQIPEKEKQRLKLEIQKVFLPEEGEKLDLGQVQGILSQVPEGEEFLQEAILQFNDLIQRGGIGPEGRQVFEQLQKEAAQQTQAQLESVKSEFAQRGLESSGLEAARKDSSIQAQANRSQERARALASEAESKRLLALGQQAGLGAQQAGLQSQRQRALADVALKGEQSRSGLRQAQRIAKQAQEAERVGTGERQQQANINLERRGFEDQFRKLQLRAGTAGQIAQAETGRAANQAAAAQAKAAGSQALFGSLVGAGATIAASDKNLKKDISRSEDTIRRLLDKLDPYKYKYKDEKFGEGEHLGVMAQDLEKSEEGSKYVTDTPEGKMVDYGKMAPTILASLADMHKRVEDIEQKKDEFNNGGVKRGALGSIIDKKKGYDYQKPLDAKDQIAQFNRLNGRKYADGDIVPVQNTSFEDGNSSRTKLFLNKLADISNEIEGSARTSQQDAISRLQSLANPTFANGGISGDPTNQPNIPLKNYPEEILGEDYSPEKPHEKYTSVNGETTSPMSPDVMQTEEFQKAVEQLKELPDEEISQALEALKQELVQQVPEDQISEFEQQFENIKQIVKQETASREPAFDKSSPEEMGAGEHDYLNEQGGYADGGMAYEDGGEGTIIPGDNYAGDELPDRINSGEMVLNVEQQQRLLDEMKKLKGKRVDDMLEEGEMEVNPLAQEKLMDVARGELPAEEIQEDDNIIEAQGFKKLLGMLGRK